MCCASTHARATTSSESRSRVDRTPIARLGALAHGTPAHVSGRIVAADDGTSWVQDRSGIVPVSAERSPPAGSWVLCEGTWDGTRITDARLTAVGAQAQGFPRPDGEWARLQTAGVARLLCRRADIVREIRRFFESRGSVEVETPSMVPSPGLELHLEAFEVIGADAPRWLITSPEYQMKRLLAGGMERIHQICRSFRRDERGALHEPEFTMLEWYQTFAGSDEIMRDTEELVAHVARTVTGGTRIPGRGRPVDVAPPWPRVSVAEAFERHAGVAAEDLLHDERAFFQVLVDRVEPQLGVDQPVFLTEWPAQMASLSRLLPDRPDVADRMEAYVDGVELCNGFGELVDAVEQRQRLLVDQRKRQNAGKPVYPIDERFLDALTEGLPPCGGNALGVDRLAMLILGVTDIADLTAIPSSRA